MRIEDARLTFHEALAANVAEHPAKVFMSSHERAYSYAETQGLAREIAAYMRAKDVGKGDRVAVLLPRMPELVVAFLGCSMIGALPAPINYTLSRHEIERSIRSCQPSLLIVHSKFLGGFDLASLDIPGLGVVVVGGGPGGNVPWEEACSPVASFEPASVGFHDVAYLNYTTGSTGDPKGAIATHANIYWNTRASVDAMEITGEDVHLIMFASFAHPHELFVRPLYTGGSLVLLEEINPKTIARTIRERGVTCMMGLAPMYGLMASHPAVTDIPMLRIAESGGMFSRPDIIGDFLNKFGIPVLSVWGSTETSGIAIANTPRMYRTDGSAGRACPHYEVRLLDDDGRDVPEGEEGEMAFRGEGVVAGYFGGANLSARDGWYLSGDLARRDREGFYYFIERKSGMMKVAGLKVYPLQVELELMRHEAIAEVAVLGVEDRLRGVVPKAYVVLREGYSLDFEDLRRFCKGRMADYMIPRQVEFRESLPRIGSGKINKKALKETDG